MVSTTLVAGGAGFIGSNLVRRLIRQQPEAVVVVVDNLTWAGHLDNLDGVLDSKRCHFVEADIADREAMGEALHRFRPQAVLNLAAESHVDRSIDGPAPFVQTNVMGAFELLDAARRHFEALDDTERARFRFVQVSTDEVFGSLGPEGRFTETTAYAPNSPYAATKAAADHLARAFFVTYGMPVITTNCCNNYGPYQFPEKLVPLVILNALEGKQLPLYGDGQHVRDWLYVGDHCEALLQVAARGRPGATYNIGADEQRTNLRMVEAVCDVLDELAPCGERTATAHLTSHRELIGFVADRPGHDRRYAIDASRIRSELGWRPTTSYADGIRHTVRFYLESSSWCQRVTEGKYDRERLGLSR